MEPPISVISGCWRSCAPNQWHTRSSGVNRHVLHRGSALSSTENPFQTTSPLQCPLKSTWKETYARCGPKSLLTHFVTSWEKWGRGKKWGRGGTEESAEYTARSTLNMRKKGQVSLRGTPSWVPPLITIDELFQIEWAKDTSNGRIETLTRAVSYCCT